MPNPPDPSDGSSSTFIYGIVTAIIGAAATQIGIWISASKQRASADRATDTNVRLAQLQRDGVNHDQLVAMLKDRLDSCETDRDSDRDKWNKQLDDAEQKNIELQRALARLRFYAGILRGILVTHGLPVPDISVYDINDDRESRK